MRFRPNPWLLALGMIAVCGGVAGWLWSVRSAPIPPGQLASYMPAGTSALISINVAELRRQGILDLIAGSSAVEEPDYRTFVDLTGFDYRQDLDHLLIGFHDDETYVVMSGRYDWEALRQYARQHDGLCAYSLCRMKASDGSRTISFFPLRRSVLALATSSNEWAATEMQTRASQAVPDAWLEQPLMISVSKDALQHPDRSPAALRSWFQLLEGAEHLVLTVGPNEGRFEIQMKLRCTKPDDSSRIQARLLEATQELKRILEREGKEADGATLAGVLAAGAFQVSGNEIEGRFPVDRAFLESLAGGKI